MAFVTGLMLIDSPASALNNSGEGIRNARTDNTVAVKSIRTGEGEFAYVSAQSFRYWLRTTLESGDWGWQSAPIYREEKVAYTDANPIKWWDDDLLGYMRAPSKKTSAAEKRESDTSRVDETPTTDTVTRVSPLRVSTLVSIARTNIVNDYNTMSRHEGDPVPYEHQFYRTHLKGLFSLDLHASGRFSYRKKTGFRNLDDERVREAQRSGLEHNEPQKEYVLAREERVQRIASLFEGLAHLEGGAKQTIHYTDVAPSLVILAVTRGGNHIFGHTIGTDSLRLPTLKIEALNEALSVFESDILSAIYVGWVRGYLDEQRGQLENALAEGGRLEQEKVRFVLDHPRVVLSKFVEDLKKPENSLWLD